MQGRTKRFRMSAWLMAVAMLLGAGFISSALAEEKPQYGGVMKVAIAGDPPSLDMHQETTFLVKIPMSNIYNTLIVFDPHGYPKIIGDLAKSWGPSEDGKSWTFKLHEGVKFHDGSELTSADVKASWEKIVFPPKGSISTKRSYYGAIKSIEAPDPYTVVFHLHYPSASFEQLMAIPHNFIFSKKKLDEDPNWYKLNTMGTGPYMMKKFVRGSTLEVERNPNYFKKGLPIWMGSSIT